MQGVVLEYLKSYLTDREQYVGIDGAKSSYEQVYYGAPQGTILGPLLFKLYVNNVKMCVKYLVIAVLYTCFAVYFGLISPDLFLIK